MNDRSSIFLNFYLFILYGKFIFFLLYYHDATTVGRKIGMKSFIFDNRNEII